MPYFVPIFQLHCPHVNISVNKKILKSHNFVLKNEKKKKSTIRATVLSMGKKLSESQNILLDLLYNITCIDWARCFIEQIFIESLLNVKH